jgi:DNA-binding MarR family transcriptional regulator
MSSTPPFTTADLPRRVSDGLARIGMVMKSEAWKQAGPAGLTPTQAQILALLNARGGALRLSAVAGDLAVTPATASEAVAALVTKRMARKTPAADDGRAVAIELTAKGRRRAASIGQWPDALAAATGALEPPEQEVLLRALAKMIRRLQQEGRIPLARMCVNCRYFRPNAYPGSELPHHCDYVDAPFGDRHLRLECREFEEERVEVREVKWKSFAAGVG